MSGLHLPLFGIIETVHKMTAPRLTMAKNCHLHLSIYHLISDEMRVYRGLFLTDWELVMIPYSLPV